MGKSFSVHTYIHTETNFSCPGGTITGVININATSKIPAGQLFIKLIGHERSCWRLSSKSRMDTTKTFFELLYPVWHFDGTLEKGQFTIPFNLKLPGNMVPSFEWQELSTVGSIFYTLEATVPDSKHFESYQSIIWINSLMDQSIIVPPAISQKSLKVSSCYCCKTGITELLLEVSKPAICMDEKIDVSVKIDNTQGKHTVLTLECILRRIMRLKAKSIFGTDSKVQASAVGSISLATNIPPGGFESHDRYASYDINFQTKAEDWWAVPSVATKLVECEYYIEVFLNFDNYYGDVNYCTFVPIKLYNGMIVMNTQFTAPPLLATDWSPIGLSSVPIDVDCGIHTYQKREDEVQDSTHIDTKSLALTTSRV